MPAAITLSRRGCMLPLLSIRKPTVTGVSSFSKNSTGCGRPPGGAGVATGAGSTVTGAGTGGGTGAGAAVAGAVVTGGGGGSVVVGAVVVGAVVVEVVGSVVVGAVVVEAVGIGSVVVDAVLAVVVLVELDVTFVTLLFFHTLMSVESVSTVETESPELLAIIMACALGYTNSLPAFSPP